MDRASEVVCCGCGTKVPRTSERAEVWACTCGRRLRHTGDGRTKDASPEFLAASEAILALDREFDERKRPTIIQIGGRKSVRDGLVAPTDPRVFRSTVCIVLVWLFLTAAAWIQGKHSWAIGLAVASVFLLGLMLLSDGRKRKEFRALTSEFEHRRAALVEKLKSVP